MRRTALWMVALAMVAAACSKAPTAPGSGSVTITGAVVSGAGSASATAAMTSGPSAAVPGLVVSVVGTEISAPVGFANQFVLREVPSGNIHLQFSAPGINALLGLQAVREGETVLRDGRFAYTDFTLA